MPIKLIIFDLDGVLVETKDLHFNALNMALKEFQPDLAITLAEHLSIYDGMSSAAKLDILTKRKGLPAVAHGPILDSKQKHTRALLESAITPSRKFQEVFLELKKKDLRVCVASNSVRETVDLVLGSM